MPSCSPARDCRQVSIRSPHRSEGRPGGTAARPATAQFQSAPPTEVRGDFRPNRGIDIGKGVSIRSPHRSEGRRMKRVSEAEAKAVSIRSPHRSEGRRWLQQPAEYQRVRSMDARFYRMDGEYFRLAYRRTRQPVVLHTFLHCAKPAAERHYSTFAQAKRPADRTGPPVR